MVGVPLDMGLAATGYLKPPDGAPRYIEGLGRLMQAASKYGVRFYWSDEIPDGCHGYTYCWSRECCISPEIVSRPAWWVRRVIAHELGHALGGPSCDVANSYRWGFCAEETEPEWVG